MSKSSKTDLRAKETEANAARERFMSTLHELQHRLHPKTIAHDVKETVKEKATGVADRGKSAAKQGVATAQAKPATAAAVAVPVLLFIFRKPIAAGLNWLFAKQPKEEPALQPYEAARHPAPLPVEPMHVREHVPAEQGA